MKHIAMILIMAVLLAQRIGFATGGMDIVEHHVAVFNLARPGRCRRSGCRMGRCWATAM